MNQEGKILSLSELHNLGCLTAEHKERIEKGIADGDNILVVGWTKGGKTIFTRSIINAIEVEKAVLFLSCDGDIYKDDFTERVALKISKESFNSSLLERIGCDTEAFDVIVVDELRPLLMNTGEDVDSLLQHYINTENKQLVASLSRQLGLKKLNQVIKSNLPDYMDISKVLVVNVEKVNKKPIVDFVGYINY